MHIYYSHPAGKIEKKFLQYIKVFAEPKDQEHLEALEKGFIYSNDHGKEYWMQSRGTRCDLSKYDVENPVIDDLRIEFNSNWSDKHYTIFKQFCQKKNFKMYDEDTYIIPENSPIADNLVSYYYKDKLVAWSKLRYFREASTYETNLFIWDYSNPKLKLGENSFIIELNWIKDKTTGYAYLGPGYERSSIYKADIPGFEWWTGKEWSSDKEIFKDLCKNDSTIRSLNDLINS